MSVSNKNKFSKTEKLAWSAAALGSLGAAALFSGPAHEAQAPREQSPIVTEVLSDGQYQEQVETPAAKMVDTFVARLQETQYAVEKATGTPNGDTKITINGDPREPGHPQPSHDETISAYVSGDKAGYTTILLGNPIDGELSVSKGERGTDIVLMSESNLDKRIVNFHNDGQLNVSLDDLSSVTAAISDKRTIVESVAKSGVLTDMSATDRGWMTDPSGSVATTFEHTVDGFRETVDRNEFKPVPGTSTTDLPSAADVVAWQMDSNR